MAAASSLTEKKIYWKMMILFKLGVIENGCGRGMELYKDNWKP